MNKTAILKACDRSISIFMIPWFSERQFIKVIDVTSLLIIRPGGIGDAVLLIPVVRALKEKYPAAMITILAERRNSAVFALCSDVDQVLRYDRPLELLTATRGTYDVVIDTEQWHRLSAVVARLTRAPMLIGYATNQRARLFNCRIPYSHDDYESDSFFSLVAPLEIQFQQVPERFLEIPEAAIANASKMLIDLDCAGFVAIFPGASIAERRWGIERFRQVTLLLSKLGIQVVVVGGSEDREAGETIVAGGVGLNLAGRTSLVETAAVIDKSVLLVSGDSGVLHIAVGLGKPTVSLFGPGRSRKWAPKGVRHVVINKELSCSPCTTYGTTPSCPDNAQCMQEITVDEVYNAITMQLTSSGALGSLCCKRDWIEVATAG